MKQVKGMKKYSALFLLVVLLNSTSKAQTINQSATATESLSRTAVTALQSLGWAVTAIFYPGAEIANPATPAPLPLAAAKAEAAPVKVAAQAVVNAGATAYTQTLASGSPTLIPGHGFRNSVSKGLKSQTTGDQKNDGLIVSAATDHDIQPPPLHSGKCQESTFNGHAL